VEPVVVVTVEPPVVMTATSGEVVIAEDEAGTVVVVTATEELSVLLSLAEAVFEEPELDPAEAAEEPAGNDVSE